jgi:hypothetical protein
MEAGAAYVQAFATDLRQTMGDAFAGAIVGITSWGDALKSIFNKLQDWVASFLSGVFDQVLKGFAKLLSGGGAGGFKGIQQQFQGLGGTKTSAIGSSALIGGSIGYAAGANYGTKTGILMGAGSGAAAGAMIGANPALSGTTMGISIAVGAGVGALMGWWGGRQKKKEQQKLMLVDKQELVEQFGGLEKLRETANRLGVDMDKAFTTTKPKEFGKILEEFGRKLAVEEATIARIAKGLGDVTATGGILTPGLMKDIKKAPPGSQEDIAAFAADQTTRGVAGIGTYLEKSVIRTAGGAAAIAGGIAALYQSLQEQGLSATAAFAQLEPLITAFGVQSAKVVGVEVPAAFAQLQAFAKLARDEIAGPVFEAVAGLEQGMTAVFNLGLMNQESFAGFTQELAANYSALELQGKGGILAMQGMRGAFQKVYELQADFGYEVDDRTQQMLDFAKSSGLIGDEFRPAADRMVLGIEKLVARFDTFLEKLAGTGTAAGEGARGIERAFGGVNVPEIGIPYRYRQVGGGIPGGGEVDLPGGTVPVLGAGGIVTRPTLALIGDRGAEAVVPLPSAFGEGGDTVIVLDGDVIARSTLKRQARILRGYGAIR